MAESENIAESELNVSLNARREARRRKILENAKSRLEKLGYSGSGDSDPVDGKCDYSDPEVEPNIIPPQTQTPLLNGNYTELFSTFNSLSDNNSVAQKPFFFKARGHILLAAALSYIISLLNIEAITGYSVFIPAGAVIAIELLYFREQRQINPITNLFITICGVQSQKAKKFLHFFSTIQGLISDIGLFVFSYCFLTFSLVCLSNGFTDLAIIK